MPGLAFRTCPVLVGREAELAKLNDVLHTAIGGRCVLAAVTGEAGVGKSRLLREAAAAGREFQVLAGYCREQDRDYPFAPFVEALREHLRRSGAAVRIPPGPENHALASLLPELATHLPSPPLELPPEQEKRRRFEAVTALLRHLTARQPILLLLEDLHWADTTSLELLELLTRRLATDRVAIIATARTDEPGSTFGSALVRLRRERLLDVEIALEPLDRQGVSLMLEHMLSLSLSSVVTQAVHERTGGNPFFVEELIAAAPPEDATAWLSQEAAVPKTVRDTVLQRLQRLDANVRFVANVAAVCGLRWPFELLVAACGLPEEDVLTAVEVLVEQQVLVEWPSEGQAEFAFRHALVREAIYSRLLLPRRRALHRLVGEVGEAQKERLGDGDLGYHFHAGQQWEKTLLYAARAGEAARAVHATAEAQRHYRRALDAAKALHTPSASDLHRRCGQCLALLGAFEAAKEHLEEALQGARLQGNLRLEQEALYDLAGLYASRDYNLGRQMAEEALALARRIGDSLGEALALNRLGNILTNLLHFAQGRALHEEALQRFAVLNDRWGSADSLDLIGMARYLSGEVPEARAAFGQAAMMFQDLNDPERVASALTSSGLYLAVLDGPCGTDASPSKCRQEVEAGLALCRQLGWRAGEIYALVALACLDVAEGRHSGALRLGESALAMATEIGHHQWSIISLLTLGLVHADLFDFQGALSHFSPALESARAGGFSQWTERLEAWDAYCRSRLRVAGAVIALQGMAPADFRPSTIGQRRALCGLIHHQLAAGRAAQALEMLEGMLTGASGPRPSPLLLLYAQGLAAEGKRDEAEATLLEARRLALEFGPRSVLWQCAAERSALWRDQDGQTSSQEARLARTEVAALAASVGSESLRSAFLHAPQVRPWAGPGGRSRTALAPGVPGGLTAREGEVAVYVAQGLTNKGIAEQLTLSEKTVEMHVSSCLGKLGFTSRTQLAAWVVGERLASMSQGAGQHPYRDG
ncbi:MAG: AAA family ATPase [Chloroflexi bacterium]|nr:AAA family ATPase [Chloroflexota bacterium]